MVRKSTKFSLEPKQQATQFGIEVSLGDSLMWFVKEEMGLLNLSTVTEYVVRLVSEEKARRALQEDVRLQQLEIRQLSVLHRRRRNDRLESTN